MQRQNICEESLKKGSNLVQGRADIMMIARAAHTLVGIACVPLGHSAILEQEQLQAGSCKLYVGLRAGLLYAAGHIIQGSRAYFNC